MRYFVIGPDGSSYGPADIPTLAQWAQENRLQATTMLREEMSGNSVVASSVPGIFAAQAPTMSAPTMAAPVQTGYTPGMAAYPRGGEVGGMLPDRLARKFSWGAFGLHWIWGLNHKKPILLAIIPVSCIPFGGLIMAIWAGKNGYQWAWESGRFSSVQHLEECEKIWDTWGIVIFVVSIVLCFAWFAAGGMAAARGGG
ncbi:MAG: hypothetical protein JSS72_07110 [Armatimonadetes bacterium]|nr:hypothetical protein [Armatimonadota bacterium]